MAVNINVKLEFRKLEFKINSASLRHHEVIGIMFSIDVIGNLTQK